MDSNLSVLRTLIVCSNLLWPHEPGSRSFNMQPVDWCWEMMP